MAITRQSETLLLNPEMDEAKKKSVQRRVLTGELHRIANGVTTSLPKDQWPSLMQREKLRILNALFPDSVISHKSSFNALVGPVIYLTTTGRRKVLDLPGLQIIAYPGAGPAPGDRKMGDGNVYFPSQARMFLDNMSRNDGNRNASREELEERILQICDIQGEAKLIELRNEMEQIAPLIGRESQEKDIGKLIGAVLGTRPSNIVISSVVRSASDGYDSKRTELFDALISELRTTPLPSIRDVAPKGNALVNFAFLESYFSNFIEGTEFEIEEARQIVLEGKISELRPKDSHDIIGVFKQIVDPGWRLQTLSNSGGVINQLTARHADMMAARPETRPGEIKLKSNRAGNTSFVQPRLVKGTFIEGAKRLHEVEPGLARALYSMFLVAEVHPFNDGNGRLARLVMNAELSQEGLCRIMVPTLYRETYIDCLRVLTREGNPKPFIKAMTEIQGWTSAFEYDNLDAAIENMNECNAFEKSLTDFRLEFPKQDREKYYPEIPG